MSDKSFLNRMKNLLFTGLLVVVPFLVAVWMSWWIYDVLTVWAIGLAAKLKLPGMEGEASSFWVRQGIRILALFFMIVVLLLV